MTINLSEIQIVPIKPINGHLGFCSMVIDSNYYVGGIAIHSRPDGGIRLVYPQKQLPNGKIINCFHPINKEAGQSLLNQTVRAYEELGGRRK